MEKFNVRTMIDNNPMYTDSDFTKEDVELLQGYADEFCQIENASEIGSLYKKILDREEFKNIERGNLLCEFISMFIVTRVNKHLKQLLQKS